VQHGYTDAIDVDIAREAVVGLSPEYPHSQPLQQSVGAYGEDRSPAPIQVQGNLNFCIPLTISTAQATTPSQSEQPPSLINAFETRIIYLPQHARNPKDGTPPSPGMRFEDLLKRRIARSSARSAQANLARGGGVIEAAEKQEEAITTTEAMRHITTSDRGSQ